MSIVNDIVQSIKNFKKNKTISEIKSSNKKNIDTKMILIILKMKR